MAGVGYLLGVGVFGIAWTELLILGVPMRGIGIVASFAVFVLAGVIVGRLRGMAVPAGRPRWRWNVTPVTVAGIALIGMLLEALFRSARLQGLQTYDAWAFWVPKAKAIFFFDGLDKEVFTTAPGPSYPPLLPILDATAFHAMGGVDPVTLHVQFWFFVVGGVAAIAGCLHARVPDWLLWPSLLLVLVVPRFGERLLVPQADVLVDLLFVVAVLLVAVWLHEGDAWRLPVATVLLAAAALTKREGVLFAACVVAGALVVSWTRRGSAWPRLLASATMVAAAVLPWRLWYGAQGIASDAPSTGWDADAGRLWSSLRLSVDVLYSNALWSVLPIVATVALVAGAIWGDRTLTTFFASVLGLLFLGGVWLTFGYSELPITTEESVNPIVRYTGAIVLLAACAAPMLLASVWRADEVEP